MECWEVRCAKEKKILNGNEDLDKPKTQKDKKIHQNIKMVLK